MSIKPTPTVIGLSVALLTACSSPQEADGDTATGACSNHHAKLKHHQRERYGGHADSDRQQAR